MGLTHTRFLVVIERMVRGENKADVMPLSSRTLDGAPSSHVTAVASTQRHPYGGH